MCKYPGPSDTNYRIVVDTIKGFFEFSSTKQLWNIVRRNTSPRTAEEQTIMQAKMLELLVLKADPNLLNYNKKSALHLAVQNQNALAVQILLWEEPCLDIVDSDGKTPLQIAMDQIKRNPSKKELVEIYETLRQAGASMNTGKKSRHPLKQGEIALTSSYYIEGLRLNSNGARARISHSQKQSKLPLDCENACKIFKLDINSFCPSQKFPLRRFYQRETIFDALYTEKSRDLIPPKPPLPEFNSNPNELLRQIQEVPSSCDFTWYHLPANNVGSLCSKKTKVFC